MKGPITVVTGDNGGQVKVVRFDSNGSSIIRRWGEQTREREIWDICSTNILSESSTRNAKNSCEGEEIVAVGFKKSGVIEIRNISDGSLIREYRGTPDLAGLELFQANEGIGRRRILTCSTKGSVFIDDFRVQSEEERPQKRLKESSSGLCTFDVKGNISRARVGMGHGGASLLAVGGKGNLLSVYDLETQNQAWKAKNLRSDELGIAHEVFVTDLAFRPAELDQVAVTTAFSEVFLYDLRSQRRPISSFGLYSKGGNGTFPHVTTLVWRPDGIGFFVGDIEGGVRHFDVRTGKVLLSLKRIGGSIRAMRVSPSGEVIASVGDRTVRINDIDSGALLSSMYLKVQGTAVLFTSMDEIPSGDGEVADVASDDSEDDEAGATNGKRRLKDVLDDLEQVE